MTKARFLAVFGITNRNYGKGMLLLVADTSGKNGCVALARAGEETHRVEMVEEVPLAGGTFSAQLVPQIADLLARNGYGKAEIGAFVVVSGPGSFTGLRVGLAAIKALAEILQKPIVPISLLEVIARSAGRQGRVCAVIDAGRGEVYVGEYEVTGDAARLLCEELIPKARFTFASDAILATADPALAKLGGSVGATVAVVAAPGAGNMAELGWRKLQSGQTVSPEQLEANYIRRSDAEIFAAK